MSGILAVAGAGPVDPDLLAAMTRELAARGPHGRDTRIESGVGLSHAFLDLGGPPRSAGAGPPSTLDGKTWIVCDARIDGRAELARRLASRQGRGPRPDPGRDVVSRADPGRRPAAGPDSIPEGAAEPPRIAGDLARAADDELLLRAYRAWGVGLVERLVGDFAFVLWDAGRRRLVCARDHFGVKPLYYVARDAGLLVSNSVAALRRHPDVDDAVDEAAVADYLLFGFNRRLRRTGLATVRKLPPAHVLVWEPGGAPSIRRYWSLPVDRPVSLDSDAAYVERFLELLESAVQDRLRGEPAAVLMSGGLDSTSVAAVAAALRRPCDGTLRAITFTYERRLDDPEGRHAETVAASLGIPAHRIELDDDDAVGLRSGPPAPGPEPVEIGPTPRLLERLREVAPDVRVGLTGQGGDPATHLSPADFWHQLGGRRALRTGLEVLRWWWRRGRLPRVGVRTGIKRWLRPDEGRLASIYPPWVAPDLEARLDLRARWRELDAQRSGPDDAVRPEAWADLASSLWPALMERYDPGFTGVAAEIRHPYLDRRLVEFLLAVPPVPWCVEKELVRVAMRGRLPEAVRTRRKAPLPGFPAHLHLEEGLEDALRVVRDTPALGRFIDVERFLGMARNRSRLRPSEHYLVARPLGLASWLRGLSRAPES